MELNVAQLLQDPVGATREYDIDETADIIGDGKEYRARGECRLLRTRRGILVKCNLDSEIEMQCGRCLNHFHHPLKIKFEEEFLPTVDVTSGLPLPQGDDATAFTIDERHILDLAEPARQYALMAVPMKPLCKAACSGLCPRCGKNLNQGNCECPAREIDPRWAKLKKLL